MGDVIQFRRKEAPIKELIISKLLIFSPNFMTTDETIKDYEKQLRAKSNIELLEEYEARLPIIKEYQNKLDGITF